MPVASVTDDPFLSAEGGSGASAQRLGKSSALQRRLQPVNGRIAYDEDAMNTLYYGDNLDILRRYVSDETVDLVYLDPPFKSNQDYNVRFAERDGSRSAAQIKAFEDTWCWDQAAARAYQEVVEAGGRVSRAMQAFRQFLDETRSQSS